MRRAVVPEQRLRAEILQLRKALQIAREGILGHFDDDCPECQSAIAAIDAALQRQG